VKDSPNLDLLRSCAVGFVLIDHLRRPFLPLLGASEGRFTDMLGSLGVAIFFVHTTLVLMQSLERTGSAPWPFYVRRAFRIYPLSIVMVCLCEWMFWASNGFVDFDALVSNLLLVQNLTGDASRPGPLWTLPYEVQMYLLLPFLFVLARGAQAVQRIAALWVSAIALVVAMALLGLYYYPLRFIPCFLPGVLAYTLGRQLAKTRSPWLLFAVVGLGVLMLPLVAIAKVQLTPLLWLFCAALGFTIPHCRELTSPLLARCAKVVATYSYGIYLTHTLIIAIAFNGLRFLPLPVQVAVFLVLIVALPWAAYRYVEAPGIALGKRLAGRMRLRGVRVASAE
jgi:peptidoglycan/LPS O-acetylase OafA/YrhL